MSDPVKPAHDPYENIRTVELAWIPLPDGRKLAARLWLPKDAEQHPVPAILEYIPYRRRDGTRLQDDGMHAWVAAQGYVCARVDIAGSGDSEGILRDEYTKQEQDDACQVVAWLASQQWCDGNVGMIGISWGGFNALQTAVRQPSALKAVVTVGSTVDRYAHDVHYMGGCLLVDDLDWGAYFFAVAGLPPDPVMVGAEWKRQWRERLESLHPFPAAWLQHQRRDAFWEHGSVCEQYAKLNCAVLAVGGWADGYTATVFRIVEALNRPNVKGIVGSWGHLYPHQGIPGPTIGFLQECVRWWDRWLKGKANDVENEPALRLWLQDYVAPKNHYGTRPGQWIGLDGWPAAEVHRTSWFLNAEGLTATPSRSTPLTIRSPQTTGLANGDWYAYALGKISAELPSDQRIDDAGSLVFDSDVLDQPVLLCGDPVLSLEFVVDKPVAMACVRLSDVAPDGQVTKVTYGLLNLTHRDSHADPSALEPGRRYRTKVRLKEIAYRFPRGHRIRVSIATTCFPLTWPSPEPVTLTVYGGGSSIELPCLAASGLRSYNGFTSAEYAESGPFTVVRPDLVQREIVHDLIKGTTVARVWHDDGCIRIDDIDTEVLYSKLKEICIADDDPLSMQVTTAVTRGFRRQDWDIRLDAKIVMKCERESFSLESEIAAYDSGVRIFDRRFHHRIARDCL